MAHTPGEWFVGESELDPQEWGFDGTVWAPPLERDVTAWAASDKQGPDPEPLLIAEHIDHKDDAVLIAGAGRLLTACEIALTLVSTMQGMPPTLDLIEEVRECLEIAIAKAKGQP